MYQRTLSFLCITALVRRVCVCVFRGAGAEAQSPAVSECHHRGGGAAERVHRSPGRQR